jgi:uncharacterized phage-associated protein
MYKKNEGGIIRMYDFVKREVLVMYSVYDIANWFLANMKNITNKKLQKLVYYAYAWYLVLNNEATEQIDLLLFENRFEAWVHGAVYPDLYGKYKTFGSGPLPAYAGDLPPFSEDDIDILNQIKEVYGKFTGNELESICHQEIPWLRARNGLGPYDPSHNPIKDTDIFEYYSER